MMNISLVYQIESKIYIIKSPKRSDVNDVNPRFNIFNGSQNDVKHELLQAFAGIPRSRGYRRNGRWGAKKYQSSGVDP